MSCFFLLLIYSQAKLSEAETIITGYFSLFFLNNITKKKQQLNIIC